MDHEGAVEVIEVELIEQEFNEGLRLCPFDPSIRLIDLFGAEDTEDIGQCQNDKVQHQMALVGLKTLPGHKTKLWRKFYEGGIFTPYEE